MIKSVGYVIYFELAHSGTQRSHYLEIRFNKIKIII